MPPQKCSMNTCFVSFLHLSPISFVVCCRKCKWNFDQFTCVTFSQNRAFCKVMFTKLELTYFCRGRWCSHGRLGGCEVARRKCIFLTWEIFWDYAGRPQEDVMLNFKPDLGQYFGFGPIFWFWFQKYNKSKSLKFGEIGSHSCIHEYSVTIAAPCDQQKVSL